MKKYGILFSALLLCFAFSACGKSSSNETSKEPEGNTIATENDKEQSNKRHWILSEITYTIQTQALSL
ncbi:hypothetical protein [Bacillus velezensis]|uniref:hypothetical protein n=1 Tax=Bacillus velezensis TaxID=492670 RepID=UPI002415DC38|nr:hypothetical protein [Bacillus velezensis]